MDIKELKRLAEAVPIRAVLAGDEDNDLAPIILELIEEIEALTLQRNEAHADRVQLRFEGQRQRQRERHRTTWTQLEQAKTDAERYRHIRASVDPVFCQVDGLWCNGAALDEAIDDAMKEAANG